MKTLQGLGVSQGLVEGKLFFLQTSLPSLPDLPVQNVASELSRLEEARRAVMGDLNRLYEQAVVELGQEDAAIFQIHVMMLEDASFLDVISTLIREESLCAERAVQRAADQFSKRFLDLDDLYMSQRASDVIDVGRNLVHALSGGAQSNALAAVDGKVILVAEDLLPSETVQLDKSKVLAFVTRDGSQVSHTAILARTMGIPAVVGLGEDAYSQLEGASSAVVDGFTGSVLLNPDHTVCAWYHEKQAHLKDRKHALLAMHGKPTQTRDGIRVDLCANIGGLSDLDLAIQNDAEGIGLFRSEFLFMEQNDFPSEERQFVVYRTALERMKGKRVIVRTLDAGADKQISYLNLPHEENPAMGCRAVRLCLAHPALFMTQLRALLRASAYGKLGIMVPMITSLEEVLRVKELLNHVELELKKEGLLTESSYEFGIMIETPAAALISDLLARHVDFFSVGTNDLTQYVLAADRMNRAIQEVYNQHHPAVLRLIRLTAENGKKAGIWTGICGESAADLELLPTYLALGVTELSIPPTMVLELREAIRKLDIQSNLENHLSLV